MDYHDALGGCHKDSEIGRRHYPGDLRDKLPPTFKCDPEKNKDCKKSNCFRTGGRCFSTFRKEFAADENKAD